MLVIPVFWLAAIFITFGLFAPRNATVIAALFVAALSVSGAIFLILEMYTPFGGLIEISSAPLRACSYAPWPVTVRFRRLCHPLARGSTRAATNAP